MDIIDFVKKSPQRHFKKGEYVLSEGEVSTKLLAIAQGFVKVVSVDDDGSERGLWVAGRYDIVPTEQLFSQRHPLKFFYSALSDGVAYEVNKKEFLDFAKTDLQLMTEIAKSMSTHYDDLMMRINSVERTNVHDKIIATLHYLAERFSAERSVDLYELGLKITHQDLADMLGSTRETTSLELHKLRKEGFIDYDRTKLIVHLDKTSLVV